MLCVELHQEVKLNCNLILIIYELLSLLFHSPSFHVIFSSVVYLVDAWTFIKRRAKIKISRDQLSLGNGSTTRKAAN